MSELRNWRPANSSDIGRCDVAYFDYMADVDAECEEELIEQQDDPSDDYVGGWTLSAVHGNGRDKIYEESSGTNWRYAYVPIAPRDMIEHKAYPISRLQGQRLIKTLQELSRLHLICCDLDKPESEWIESDYAFIPPFKNAVELLREIGVETESKADSRTDREPN